MSLANLTRNIKSYVENGGSRRKVVLATSRALTPKRVKNLYARAAQLGFALIQVHSQEAIANLLYRNSTWCRELLNLIGEPAPLSVVPRTVRPLLSHALIGREADLIWLRENEGDKLLVGQPGSGKTFLLHKLANEGDSLFVVSRDRREIASGIRSQQPKALILDDAQVELELLTELKQMREATGASFSIFAELLALRSG